MSIKRSRTPILFTAICIIFIVYFGAVLVPDQAAGHFWSHRYSSCSIASSSHPYIPSNSSRLKWRQVPIKHPITGSGMQLPSSAPKQLPMVQYKFSQSHAITASQQERRDAVKAVFQRSWNSYKEKAWLKDELLPISGTFNNKYGGWGATLVDNLDTLWMMGLRQEFDEAVAAAANIDFSNPEILSMDTISIFETTIRFVGGFLSAYDLTDCKDKRLLDKAVEIGDMLYVAFDTESRMPVNTWNPRKAFKGEDEVAASDDNIMANLGSLTMEFTRLSQLTGDMRWFDAVQRITNLLDEQQHKTKLPGMWPQRYTVASNDFTQGNTFSLGAEADSTYEYLLKMYLLLGATSAADQYKKMYKYAMDTATQHVFFRPMVPDNSDILLSGKAVAVNNSTTLETNVEHLSCFLGGMVGLGSRIFANHSHLTIGQKLTEGCVWAYQASPSGIMPESVRVIPCPPPASNCTWNETVWEPLESSMFPKPFIGAVDAQYHLRPEAIESVFYMYRLTGDTKWQDTAWEMFQTIDNQTKTEFGNAALANALTKHPSKNNVMESFWLAETLKYLYLIFSEPSLISLDDFVLNTEAHPFRIPK
jgi:mannosyl-oligosaccharide alpha-1,2-mannosidase